MFPDFGGSRPVAAAASRGLYGLLDRLRAAHPHVEIETCASGGARLDWGILARTHRVWPSDQTDPVERLRIMRWQSLVAPLEVLGSHVGASGRAPMDFRAKVAAFGWMGVEADPGRLKPEDASTLAAIIAVHKRHRHILDGGRLIRLTGDDPGAGGLLVMTQDGAHGLALIARAGLAAHAASRPSRLSGLEPAAAYRLDFPKPWPAAARRLPDPAWLQSGVTISGAELMERGINLPLADPLTAWIVVLERL